MEGREKATDLGVKFVPKSKPAKHGMAFPSIPQHSPAFPSRGIPHTSSRIQLKIPAERSFHSRNLDLLTLLFS